VNQGGTTDKVFYSSLTEGIFCQGRFFYSFVREAKGLLGGKNMKISTTLNDVEKIVADGKYDVLPVSCEILSDFITPIEAMKKLKNVSKHCYMLESAQADETWGRYTFLGFDPIMEITCIGGTTDGVLEAGKLKYVTGNPSKYIREVLSQYKSPRFDDLPPFTGGLVGYFSFDFLGYSEPSVRVEVEDNEKFRDVDLMLFDKVIAFDNIRQKIILIVICSLMSQRQTIIRQFGS